MSKPALLAVATVPPWPTTNGYSLRVYHLLAELAAWWEITLVAPPLASAAAADALVGVREYVPVPLTGRWACLPSRLDARTLRDAVRRLIAERAPVAALTWHGAEFLALDARRFPPAVADRIDCLTLGTWRDFKHVVGLRERLRTCRTAWEFARYEWRVVRALPYTVVVGEDDAKALRRLSGRDTVCVVPNGVALRSMGDGAEEAPLPTVLFTGVLDFGPNMHAAHYFAEEIWPVVRGAVAQARFVIAGRHPADSVRALTAQHGVEVVPDVPDMQRLIRSAWVAVAPMTCGSGIKNKVLEAWAGGKPVVMTDLATNGLRLDESAASLVADGPARLAELIVRLLRDREQRGRLGAAGYRLAARWHTWTEAAERISALVDAARGAARAYRTRVVTASIPDEPA